MALPPIRITEDSVSVELVGWEDLDRMLKKAGDRAPQIMAAALYEEALAIFRESQKQVPVRTGVLRGSGFVTPPSMVVNGANIEIGYGGAAAPYAAIVHERTYGASGRLIYHAPPTKSKYLSDPVQEAERNIGERLERRVQDLL